MSGVPPKHVPSMKCFLTSSYSRSPLTNKAALLVCSRRAVGCMDLQEMSLSTQKPPARVSLSASFAFPNPRLTIIFFGYFSLASERPACWKDSTSSTRYALCLSREAFVHCRCYGCSDCEHFAHQQLGWFRSWTYPGTCVDKAFVLLL